MRPTALILLVVAMGSALSVGSAPTARATSCVVPSEECAPAASSEQGANVPAGVVAAGAAPLFVVAIAIGIHAGAARDHDGSCRSLRELGASRETR